MHEIKYDSFTVQVEIPKGYYVVTEGLTKKDDLIFVTEPICWVPVFGGLSIRGYNCVIRKKDRYNHIDTRELVKESFQELLLEFSLNSKSYALLAIVRKANILIPEESEFIDDQIMYKELKKGNLTQFAVMAGKRFNWCMNEN